MKNHPSIHKYLKAIAPLSLLLAVSPTQAAVYTGVTGNWSLGTNWDTNPSYPNGVGAVVSRTATGTVTLTQDIASVTVGTVSITGNTAFTVATGVNAFTMDGGGLGATIENASTIAAATLTFSTGAGSSFVIADDLQIKQSNANSTVSGAANKYAISIGQRLVGTKSITITNVLNDLNYGMVNLGGGTTAAGTYTGAFTLAKGALTWSSNTAFGSTSGITLGSVNGGDVSFVTAYQQGTVAANITVAADTGGKTVLGSIVASTIQKFTGAIALNQNLTVISQMTTADTAGVQLDGVISGAGGLQINGTVKSSGANVDTAGIVKISGTNTFTGDTRVYKGTLLLGAATGTVSKALQNSTLNLDGSDSGAVGFGVNSTTTITAATLGGLSGSRDLSLQNIAATPAAVALSVGNNNSDTIYTGALSGAGSLNKIGTGKLTLGGVNTYTGATNVTNGTLAVNGSLAAGSTVTVSSGATLGGSGTVAGTTTIQGTLAAGNSIGTLSTGNLTLASTSVLDVEYGRNGTTATSDLTSVTGSVNIVSGANLKLTLYTGLSDLLGGDIIFLIDNNDTDAVQGAFTSLNGVTTTLSEGSRFAWNSQTWEITYSADYGTSSFSGGNDVALMVVPEPSTWAMLMGGIGMLAFGQRLRRRN